MAMKRGTMRKAMGSIARARSASICSVTTIVPSSAVLLAPTRPEIMSAVSSGAISRSVREAGAPPEQALGAVALHDRRRLDDHDDAREERGDDDDGQRLDRHLVEVAAQLGVVEHRRPRDRAARDLPEEHAHAADGVRDPDERGARRRERGPRACRRRGLGGWASGADIAPGRYYRPSQLDRRGHAALRAGVGQEDGHHPRQAQAGPERRCGASARSE